MSTYGEALEGVLAVREPLLVLRGWEASILTVLVWNPHSLHLFVDRLRPEVLELAQVIVVLVNNETQYFDHFPPAELEAAQAFINDVNSTWPHDANGRRRWKV